MKRNNVLIILLVLVAIISCSDNYYNLNLELEDAKGLKEEALVLCKNVEIGKVQEIGFNGNKLIVKLSIENNFIIPKDSKFYLISNDIFGTKSISVELSDNTDIYTEKDTIKCLIRTETIIDSTIQNINRVVYEIKDSLLSED